MQRILAAAVVGISVLTAPHLAQSGEITDLATETETLLEQGDPKAAMDRLDKMVDVVWETAPLVVREAVFVDSASGYGLFVPRAGGNTFKQGEKLLIYVEPVGFGYGRTGAGSYVIGFDVGLDLKDGSGKTIFANPDFTEVAQPVRYKNREFYLSLSFNFTGIPVGEYVADVVLNDKNSDKSAPFSLKFAIEP